MNVPFNKPVVLENHGRVLQDSVATGHLSGIGPFTKKCEAWLDKNLGYPTKLVTSATHAMETMAMLLDIKPGDEVIVPSFTFVSTANAFAVRGAVIRFADNDVFGNIIPSEIERLITPKTRAVIAVDYAGASADLDIIKDICEHKQVVFLEDAAQALGGTYKGRPLGTIAELGCFSFHETKNVTSGEGGALVHRNPAFVDRTEVIREKGTNRQRFFKGFVDKYTWVDIGSSYVLSDLNAAYLFPQLERFQEIQDKRRMISETYTKALAGWCSKNGIEPLQTPPHNLPNYHMHALIFPSPDARTGFIKHMQQKNVMTPFHYVPLHTSSFGLHFAKNGKPDMLEGCERISHRLARLPLYFNMTEQELGYVLENMLLWSAPALKGKGA